LCRFVDSQHSNEHLFFREVNHLFFVFALVSARLLLKFMKIVYIQVYLIQSSKEESHKFSVVPISVKDGLSKVLNAHIHPTVL
jgi:hypothetical protein